MTSTKEMCRSPGAPKAIALLVLGMHRSGTSAIAGVLHSLGLAMGNSFVAIEKQHNERGYWENADANNFNDELLRALGSEWFDALSLAEKLSDTSVLAHWDERLVELIQSNFGGQSLWAIKDPRLCRLLPIWLRVLNRARIIPKFVLILRHPAEVFESLYIRNGIEQPLAALLWLRYVLDSIRHSKGDHRSIITYEDLLEDPYGTLRKVEGDLRICLNLDNDVASKNALQYLEKGLKHHSVSSTLHFHPLMQFAIDTYYDLVKGDLNEVESINGRMESELKVYRSWVLQSNKLLADQAELKRQYERLIRHHQELHLAYKGITRSLSWRITKPLRFVKRQLRR